MFVPCPFAEHHDGSVHKLTCIKCKTKRFNDATQHQNIRQWPCKRASLPKVFRLRNIGHSLARSLVHSLPFSLSHPQKMHVSFSFDLFALCSSGLRAAFLLSYTHKLFMVLMQKSFVGFVLFFFCHFHLVVKSTRNEGDPGSGRAMEFQRE